MWRWLGPRRWAVVRNAPGLVEVVSLHWTEESAMRNAVRTWRDHGAPFPNPFKAVNLDA
jgi:hypothetical protein